MSTSKTAIAAVLVAGLAAAMPALAKDDIPDKRMYDVYREAGKTFNVPPRILAAMHFVEHGYGKGTRKGDFKGPYGFGDNAWNTHRKAYKKGKRPDDYPYRGRDIKRCKRRKPCIHDLFDSAMAAAEMLRDNGANRRVDSRGTKKALCYFNTGVNDKKCDYEKRVIKKARSYSTKRL